MNNKKQKFIKKIKEEGFIYNELLGHYQSEKFVGCYIKIGHEEELRCELKCTNKEFYNLIGNLIDKWCKLL